MNISKRGFIQKIAASLAGLPFIGWVLRPRASVCHAVSGTTEYFGITEVGWPVGRDRTNQMFLAMANEVTRVAGILLERNPNCTNIQVSWHNILDATFNPDGNVGFFKVTASDPHWPPPREAGDLPDIVHTRKEFLR